MKFEWPKFNVGERVLVFDNTLYKDDVSTPLSQTCKPATVDKIRNDHKYHPVLYDVIFDHRGLSRSHLPHALKRIDEEIT